MAYTADINIVVRGARELSQLQAKLKQTATEIKRIDDVWKGAVNGPKTLNAFNKALQEASTQLKLVKQGTDAETAAVENYVRALNLANAARERQNRLIAEQIAKQRTVVATANAGFGVQGPALPATARARGRTGGASGRDIISNAVIGGAFPLLFGQGGGAAIGGAVGGIAGGAFGGAGGFAGSLLGTLIGDIVSQGQRIRQLGQDIGFSADQTRQLEAAFSAAGREADKFESAVQNIRGLGLSIEDQADAINLAATLTQKYGGSVDKVTAAYANFVEKGKVGIADINKFTSQGIPILDQLEKKYNTNRDGVLALAKDGKISAQALSDALIAVARASDTVNKQVKTGWDKVWDDLGTGASMSVRGIVAVFSSLVGQSTGITGSIASLFSGLYRRMIEGALDAGARISRSLAATARAAANYAATMELGGINIGAGISKRAAKGAERIFTNLDQQLQGIRSTPSVSVGDITVPGQAPATGGSRGRAKKERESRIPELMRELDLARKLRDIRARILAAELADDKETVIRLQLEEKLAQIDGKRLNIMASKDPLQERLLQVQILMVEADEARAQAAQDFIKLQEEQLRKSLDILGVTKAFTDATNRMGTAAFPGGTGAGAFRTDLDLLDQQKTLLDEIQKKYPLIGEAAKSAGDLVTFGFAEMVSGAQTLQQTFANFLQTISDMLLRSAAQIITTYITMGVARMFAFGVTSAPDYSTASSSIGFNPAAFGMPLLARANGGSVNAGTPYLVGERGPELFVPGRSGTIVPNDKMGGSNVQVGSINITVENTGDTLSPQAQKQIAGQVRGIVLATLVDQQRSGGVLR